MPYFTSNFDRAQIHYRIHVPPDPALSLPLEPAPPSDAAPSQQRQADADADAVKPTLVFSHGWPFSSRMFDHLIVPLVHTHRYRCVSFDRRGFGRSDAAGPAPHTTTSSLDVFAADLAQLLDTALPPATGTRFVGIGASMGCSELLRALRRRADLRGRCAGLALLGGALPSGVHDAATNPLAPAPALWAAIAAGLRADRQAFVAEALGGVFGAHVGFALAAGEARRFEGIVDDADPVALEACIGVIARMDVREELELVGAEGAFPVLVLHGDADKSFPVEAGVMEVPKLVARATVKVYENAAHGLWLSHKERCLEDILKLLRGVA